MLYIYIICMSLYLLKIQSRYRSSVSRLDFQDIRDVYLDVYLWFIHDIYLGAYFGNIHDMYFQNIRRNIRHIYFQDICQDICHVYVQHISEDISIVPTSGTLGGVESARQTPCGEASMRRCRGSTTSDPGVGSFGDRTCCFSFM